MVGSEPGRVPHPRTVIPWRRCPVLVWRWLVDRVRPFPPSSRLQGWVTRGLEGRRARLVRRLGRLEGMGRL